jgi:hypothetical protein
MSWDFDDRMGCRPKLKDSMGRIASVGGHTELQVWWLKTEKSIY